MRKAFKWLFCCGLACACGGIFFYFTPLDELQSAIHGASSTPLGMRQLQIFGEWVTNPSCMDAVNYLRERGFLLHVDCSWSVPVGFAVAKHDLEVIEWLRATWEFGPLHFAPEIIPPLSRMH